MESAEVRRGEVWWVALDPTRGSETGKTRPCVVVQRDAANATSRTIVVCPLTSARDRQHGILNVLASARESGLAKDSIVVCNQVRTVDRVRLKERIGALTADLMTEVDRGLRAILDL